jgi:hypothetical protein
MICVSLNIGEGQVIGRTSQIACATIVGQGGLIIVFFFWFN